MRYLPFFLLLILVTACNYGEKELEREDNLINQNLTNNTIAKDFSLYQYPDWIEGCDRFRPIFQKELNKYPVLTEVFDLSILYSISYHETFCKTADELRADFISKGWVDDDSWKGGIMQVDGCWRWGSPFDCSNVQNQIRNGMEQLNFSYSQIDNKLKEYGLEDRFAARQKIALFLIAYNRGFYISNDALKIYDHKLQEGNFIISPFTKEKDGRMIVGVNCTEKDLCVGDYSEIDISEELASYSDELDKALLISCRKNYGLMKNEQGDYCTGPGYGLNYPAPIFNIYDAIDEFQKTPKSMDWSPYAEKEFYVGELNFSNMNWFVKTSIGKTGPGDNFFYLNSSSVFVDDKGRLHMKTVQSNGTLYSSEVVLAKSLGYGNYTFYVSGNLSDLGKSLVLGLFTYDLTYNSTADYFHREIDFEISKWGIEDLNNTQFAVQGPLPLQAIYRFNTSSTNDLIVSYDWYENGIAFELREDNRERTLIDSWFYDGYLVPKPGNERARINLWLYDHSEPREAEFVIKKFEFSD